MQKKKRPSKAGRSDAFKKARHLHQQVRGGGKYANKPLPPLTIDESTARPAKGGIQISTGARKLIDVLAMLLHKQSEHTDGGEVYVGKNTGGEAVAYSRDADGREIHHRLAVIEVTPYLLARHYEGGEPSGRAILRVKEWMHELASKNHVIRYDRKEDKKVVGTVDVYLPIIHLMHRRDTEQGESYVLQLNPIFRDQIANQFVLLPDDYAARLHSAFGGKPTRAAIALCDYILLKISFCKGATYSEALSFIRVAEIMGIPKNQAIKKRGAVIGQIAKAMDVACKMGLIAPETISMPAHTYLMEHVKITWSGPVRWY